jgi:hypothetical protein
MGDWIDCINRWANDNQGFTDLLFALAGTMLVGVTAFLSYLVARATQATARAADETARLTSRLVEETTRLRQIETDPDIAVYIETQRYHTGLWPSGGVGQSLR